MMEISVTDAKSQLTDLVRQAEAGGEVVLTRHGHPVARLVPMQRKPITPEQRGAVLHKILAQARANRTQGPSGAELQDELYDEFGLPK